MSPTGDGSRRACAAGLGRLKDAVSLPAARVPLEGTTLEWRKSVEDDYHRVLLTSNLTKQMSKGQETKNQTLKPREGAGGRQRGGGGRGRKGSRTGMKSTHVGPGVDRRPNGGS